MWRKLQRKRLSTGGMKTHAWQKSIINNRDAFGRNSIGFSIAYWFSSVRYLCRVMYCYMKIIFKADYHIENCVCSFKEYENFYDFWWWFFFKFPLSDELSIRRKLLLVIKVDCFVWKINEIFFRTNTHEQNTGLSTTKRTVLSLRLTTFFLILFGFIISQFYSGSIVSSLLDIKHESIKSVRDLFDSQLILAMEDVPYDIDRFNVCFCLKYLRNSFHIWNVSSLYIL